MTKIHNVLSNLNRSLLREGWFDYNVMQPVQSFFGGQTAWGRDHADAENEASMNAYQNRMMDRMDALDAQRTANLVAKQQAFDDNRIQQMNDLDNARQANLMAKQAAFDAERNRQFQQMDNLDAARQANLVAKQAAFDDHNRQLQQMDQLDLQRQANLVAKQNAFQDNLEKQMNARDDQMYSRVKADWEKAHPGGWDRIWNANGGYRDGWSATKGFASGAADTVDRKIVEPIKVKLGWDDASLRDKADAANEKSMADYEARMYKRMDDLDAQRQMNAMAKQKAFQDDLYGKMDARDAQSLPRLKAAWEQQHQGLGDRLMMAVKGGYSSTGGTGESLVSGAKHTAADVGNFVNDKVIQPTKEFFRSGPTDEQIRQMDKLDAERLNNMKKWDEEHEKNKGFMDKMGDRWRGLSGNQKALAAGAAALPVGAGIAYAALKKKKGQ